MLTFGIVAASLTGLYYSRQAEAAIAAAGDSIRRVAVENHAWRSMFLAVIYPGLIFLIGTFLVSESPRWLFRRGRREEALAVLLLSCSEEEAGLEMREMAALQAGSRKGVIGDQGSLLQRRYVVPFVLACVILGCSQATGVNSILQFLVVILKQAGMSAALATQGDIAVKVLNCAVTVAAIALVDRKGAQIPPEAWHRRHRACLDRGGAALPRDRVAARGCARQSAGRYSRRRGGSSRWRRDFPTTVRRWADVSDRSL